LLAGYLILGTRGELSIPLKLHDSYSPGSIARSVSARPASLGLFWANKAYPLFLRPPTAFTFCASILIVKIT